MKSSTPQVNQIIADNLQNGHRLSSKFRSSRLSMGNRAGDIVAVLNHQDIDESSIVFREHVNRADAKVFSIRHVGTPDVMHVGTEEDAGEGFEYLLAFVNKRTKEVEYRPVSVIQFEAMYKPSVEFLAGEKIQIKKDYSQNFVDEEIDALDKRRRLTAEFGSMKKNKSLDAAKRRKVTEDTLGIMATTSLVAHSKKEEEMEKKIKEDGTVDVSLLQQAESSVLPLPNKDAKYPSDVYSLDQFVTKMEFNEQSGHSELEAEALRFFTQFNTAQKLIKIGVAKIVANRIGDVHAFPNPAKRALHALKLVVLARIVGGALPEKGVAISLQKLEELNLPPIMMSAVRAEYFGPSKAVRGTMKISLSYTERSRLNAHFLCMMLLFDDPDFTLPISPLSVELSMGETATVKLLNGLGCKVAKCTTDQAMLHNSLRIAKLVGPPGKFGRRKNKYNMK